MRSRRLDKIIRMILVMVLVVPLSVFAMDSADVQDNQNQQQDEQQKAVLELIEKPLDNGNPDRVEDITHVMVHFMSCVTINPQNPFDVQQNFDVLKTYGVGPHYMIDRNGDVYKFLDENRVAYHAGKGEIEGLPEYTNRMNEYSIGIEMLAIGSYDDMSIYMSKEEYDALNNDFYGYTEKQYESLNLLLDDIIMRNPDLQVDRQHIIGHEDYTERKNDPGELFDWNRIVCLQEQVELDEVDVMSLEYYLDYILRIK